MIEVSDLRFSYRRDTEELFLGLNRVFPAGAVSVVTGASGRGKSTLLYLLGLLLTPRSGVVRIDGVDVSGLGDGQRSRLRAGRIGFVFQDASLDATRTVLDNVIEGGLYAGMTRRRAIREARALLDRLGVELREDHRPGEVSGGQAQRVGLCRALIKRPAVLLADEPTGNLDEETAQVVLRTLVDVARSGVTVVVASHDRRLRDIGDVVVDL